MHDDDECQFLKHTTQNASTELHVPVHCEEVFSTDLKEPELSDGL